MKNTWFKILRQDLVALLLGVILTLSFAPFYLFPLAIVAPAGLLALILNKSPQRACWLGWVFGVGLFSSGVYWIFISINSYGDVPALGAAGITGILIATLALFPALVCYFTNRYFPAVDTAKIVYAFPALWILSEWIRSWVGSGFPWLYIGYSQNFSPLKGYAPFLSVYGVSLAALLTGSLLLNALLFYRARDLRKMILNLYLAVTIWIVGGLFTFIPWTHAIGTPINISLVQGNIPQSLKWSPDHLQLSLDRYQQLTDPLWKKSQLIIWPEAAIPLPLPESSDYINELNDQAVKNNTTLIAGVPIQNGTTDTYYNAVVTLGKKQEVYIKRRLVPFGEYVPFSNLFARLFDFMQVPMANMIPGTRSQAPLSVNGLKILPAICYEIGFPELVQSPDRNINLLLTVTNDAWFGKSTAQAQHLQMAAMRAIELGRPVLFVSNDGITAVIGPNGKTLAAAPPHEIYVLNTQVQPMEGLTPWMQNGMNTVLLLVFCLLFAAIRSKFEKSNLVNKTLSAN